MANILTRRPVVFLRADGQPHPIRMVKFGQCALRVPEEQRGHFLGLVGLTAGRDPKIPSLPNRRMHGRLDPGVELSAAHLGRSVAVALQTVSITEMILMIVLAGSMSQGCSWRRVE